MGFRFRKSIQIAKGVRVNLSKSGVGASFGIPGTGMSWGVSPGRRRRALDGERGRGCSGCLGCLGVLVLATVAIGLVGSLVASR
jgi:hypothetical protein